MARWCSNHGEWVFRSTEDPMLKLMRDKGVITNKRYNEVSAQKGKNWIEPADAVLNPTRETLNGTDM